MAKKTRPKTNGTGPVKAEAISAQPTPTPTEPAVPPKAAARPKKAAQTVAPSTNGNGAANHPQPEPMIAQARPKSSAAKPAAKKPAATSRARAARRPAAEEAVAPAYTHEEICLRAYFISEKRRNEGLPGDPHLDWVEAERQLAEEHAKGARRKRARKAA